MVFSADSDSHLERLEKVLSLLQQHNLKRKPSKCHLLKSEVSYLGYVVFRNGIGTDPSKVRTAEEWPGPRTVKEVR